MSDDAEAYYDAMRDADADLYEQSQCDHEEYDIDWEGRARCHCGHSWWASAKQMEALARWEQEYGEYEAEQARKFNVWWRRLGRWIYHHLPRFRSQEIPF